MMDRTRDFSIPAHRFQTAIRPYLTFPYQKELTRATLQLFRHRTRNQE